MRVYRAYLTDDAGRFSGVKFLNCANDDDALRTARKYAAYSPVHVWDQDRFIRTVEQRSRGWFGRVRHGPGRSRSSS